MLLAWPNPKFFPSQTLFCCYRSIKLSSGHSEPATFLSEGHYHSFNTDRPRVWIKSRSYKSLGEDSFFFPADSVVYLLSLILFLFLWYTIFYCGSCSYDEMNK